MFKSKPCSGALATAALRRMRELHPTRPQDALALLNRARAMQEEGSAYGMAVGRCIVATVEECDGDYAAAERLLMECGRERVRNIDAQIEEAYAALVRSEDEVRS